MTTPWVITREWEGQTVCVIGAGPGLSRELVESVKQYKRIACNRAIAFAPDADAFVALDPHHPFWEAAKDFAGLKIIGVPDSDIEGALYAGMWYETVQIAPGHTIQIRNNALAGIRIAERMGAAKILLLGFDPEAYEAVHKETGFYGLVQGLEQIIAELRGKGIEVERVDSKPRKRK